METCETEFMVWLAKYGYSRCQHVIKTWNRKRIPDNRPARQKFPWSEYKRMYERQRGICPLCQEVMPMIRGKIEMDHVNPELMGEEFNARSNRQILCASCNREKSAMTIAQQTKHYGKTVREIIHQEDEV
jgi:5-methylcytosine-specific restriction endonuclease McrA